MDIGRIVTLWQASSSNEMDSCGPVYFNPLLYSGALNTGLGTWVGEAWYRAGVVHSLSQPGPVAKNPAWPSLCECEGKCKHRRGHRQKNLPYCCLALYSRHQCAAGTQEEASCLLLSSNRVESRASSQAVPREPLAVEEPSRPSYGRTVHIYRLGHARPPALGGAVTPKIDDRCPEHPEEPATYFCQVLSQVVRPR